MIPEIKETAETVNFVSPSLCLELEKAGLTKDTPYYWKVRKGKASLYTYIFDFDNYYKDGGELIEKIAPTQYTIPAYSTADMESVLADFFLSRNSNSECEVNYVLSFGRSNGIITKSPRMPDVFALAVIRYIQLDIVNPSEIKFLQP